MTKITGKDVTEALASDRKKKSTTVLAAVVSKDVKLTPARIIALRSRISGIIGSQLDTAEKVILGTQTWSPTQARVFSALLNKVVPDLKLTHNQHDHVHTDATKLSREDLMAIAAKASEQDPNDPDEPEILDAEYEDAP